MENEAHRGEVTRPTTHKQISNRAQEGTPEFWLPALRSDWFSWLQKHLISEVCQGCFPPHLFFNVNLLFCVPESLLFGGLDLFHSCSASYSIRFYPWWSVLIRAEGPGDCRFVSDQDCGPEPFRAKYSRFPLASVATGMLSLLLNSVVAVVIFLFVFIVFSFLSRREKPLLEMRQKAYTYIHPIPHS